MCRSVERTIIDLGSSWEEYDELYSRSSRVTIELWVALISWLVGRCNPGGRRIYMHRELPGMCHDTRAGTNLSGTLSGSVGSWGVYASDNPSLGPIDDVPFLHKIV